jgi:hypothetical protein
VRRRPSRLWLWFWGRKRRGYPGLLTAVVLLAVAGALTARSRIGYDLGYWLGLGLLAVLLLITLGALAAALIGALRRAPGPRGRR